MRLRTKKFLKEKFRNYYEKTKLISPPSIKEREWGIIVFNQNYPEKKVMKRHKSFSTKEELRTYFKSIIPAHVYFSSAYYKRPSAPTMKDKGWKGADLVFDLDADHLKGVKDLNYREMLEKVKKETIHLLEDFLLDDFGLPKENIKVVFSGGRGYHIHVRDKRVLELNSQERREIIDYLFGNGLDPIVKKKSDRGANILVLSSKDSNWKFKVLKYIITYLKEIRDKKEKEAIKELSEFEGIGKKIAKRIYNFLIEDGSIQKIKEKKKLDIVKGINKSFWEQLINKAKEEIKAEADEPVTSDIKRLIRLPFSLHAGTGFKVTPIPINDLNDFNPFHDAVVFSEEKVRIYAKENFETKIMRNKIEIEKDEIKKIPEYAAVFLSCIGKVEVEGW